MKLAALLNNRFSEVESRKKLFRTKSADDAYRKNAKFYMPAHNPAVEELMDLLTGKKERNDQPNVQQSIDNLKNESLNVKMNVDELSSSEHTTSSANVSPQGDSVSSDVSSKILPTTNLPTLSTAELKNAREKLNERIVEKAISTYKFQMSMAKNGFKILQPMIYRTA